MTQEKRYSQRKLEGLPTPEEIVVESFSNYIELFSNQNFKDYLFRGEPTNYPETISSALRENTTSSSFIRMKKEFKKEVWHKLSIDERTHFTAFSQHHGIPTNLIDVTTSPLVALYFSCQHSKSHITNSDNETGFVYLFENTLVDITHVLEKFEDDNLLTLFAYNEGDTFLEMYYLFLRFQSNHPKLFRQHFENLHNEYRSYFELSFSGNHIPDNIFSYDNLNYDISIHTCAYEFKKGNEKLERIYEQIEHVSSEVYTYTAYLQEFLRKILRSTTPVFWLDIMPNFKYEPILTFERGRNQQGLFIYQTYLSYTEEIYNYNVLSCQRFWPDKVIVIKNKDKILKELDFMGINEKFIYGNYDHIASYIRNKYQ
ncbi:hypothetical protein IEO_05556 [Bacillus wiedmannii]|uniref:FRG domain-containing protein n=1 Tax=Bacillus wiedmannii TaxID=1890302 RepID=UPI00027C193C|nr:FRG domain-containing protein [Bacillus wiedmannii]EJV56055.1 hypothetical protein IEO_05556 [Bacillus wiedmannii]